MGPSELIGGSRRGKLFGDNHENWHYVFGIEETSGWLATTA
jgi:hypothetical protein